MRWRHFWEVYNPPWFVLGLAVKYLGKVPMRNSRQHRTVPGGCFHCWWFGVLRARDSRPTHRALSAPKTLPTCLEIWQKKLWVTPLHRDLECRQARWVLRRTRWGRFGTQIIGWEELTEFPPKSSVRAKNLTELGVWNRALRNRVRPVSDWQQMKISTSFCSETSFRVAFRTTFRFEIRAFGVNSFCRRATQKALIGVWVLQEQRRTLWASKRWIWKSEWSRYHVMWVEIEEVSFMTSRGKRKGIWRSIGRTWTCNN